MCEEIRNADEFEEIPLPAEYDDGEGDEPEALWFTDEDSWDDERDYWSHPDPDNA